MAVAGVRASVDLRAEARLFSRYLVGIEPSEQCIDVYVKAVEGEGSGSTQSDARLIAFARRRPRSLGLLDAGLAAVRPRAELRRRLYLMLAILEATPENADRFLPEQRPWYYAGAVGARSARSVIKAAVGVALVLLVAP